MNIELANANLEILAVREGFLNPEFDYNITNYKVEIPNDTEKVEILAIPQSQKATVSIIGNNEMKVGNNTIQINVIAEDRITNKKYELLVHRRNEQEQLQYEQETESGAEKLSAILEEQKNNNNDVDEIKQNGKGNIIWIIGIIVLGIIIIVVVIYMIKKQKKVD